MPPIPTEAAPLKVCRQCGSAVPPPTGKGMFVHGVGAVGYQNCPRCGARWQYLFSAGKRRSRSPRWAVVGAVSVLMVGVLTVGVVAAVAITRGPDSPKRAASIDGNGEVADRTDFDKIVAHTNALMRWLLNNPTATVAQYEANLLRFERAAGTAFTRLKNAPWPEDVVDDVGKVAAANFAFVALIDPVRHGHSRDAAFTQELVSRAGAVQSAESSVRSDLGLPVAK